MKKPPLLLPISVLAGTVLSIALLLRSEHPVPSLPAAAGPLARPGVAARIATDASTVSSLEALRAKAEAGDAIALGTLAWLPSLPPADYGAAFAILRDLPEGADKAFLLGEFTRAWAAHDARAALSAAGSIADIATRQQAQHDSFRAHAASRPAEAAQWLGEAMGMADDERTALAGAALADLLAREPDAAPSFAAGLSDEATRAAAHVQIAEHRLLTQAPEAVAAWVETLADPASQTATAREVAQRWSMREPERAAAWLEKLAAPTAQLAAAASIAKNWSDRDPLRAVAWSEAQAAPALRDTMLAEAVREWTRHGYQRRNAAPEDLQATFDWIDARPSEADRQTALGALFDVAALRDPAFVMGNLDQLADPDARAWLQRKVRLAFMRPDCTCCATDGQKLFP
jgi:hypothetical protein